MNYYGYLISHDILSILILSSFYIYVVYFYLHFVTSAKLGYKIHLFLLVSVVLVLYKLEFITYPENFALLLFSGATIMIAFVGGGALAIFDYTIDLSYNDTIGELRIIHKKLWFTYDEVFSIPPKTDLEFIITKNQLAYQKSQAFHKIRYINQQGQPKLIEVASIFVAGFKLINKIYFLFQSHKIEFQELSSIYPKGIFAKFNKGYVSLPNQQDQEGYMSMDEFLEDKTEKRTLTPLMQTGLTQIPALILAMIIIFFLLYQSFSSNFQDLNILDYETRKRNYLLLFFGFYILAFYGLGKPYLIVNTGDLEITDNTESYLLTYQTKWFKPVTLEIAKVFNPLVKFENNQYIMVIFNEIGGVFYKQRLFETI